MKKFIHRYLLFSILALCFVMHGRPATAAVNQWSAIGPDGGSIGVIDVDPLNANIVYAVVPQGVIKSIDGGNTWSAIGTYNGIPEGYVNVLTLAVNPGNGQELFIGVKYYGLMKSIDGGLSWNLANQGMNPNDIHSIAFHPTNPSLMFAGTATGIFKSSNAGSSWSMIHSVYDPDGYGVANIIIDRNNPSTIFATVAGYGVLKSSNDGISWIQSNNGLPDPWIQTIQQSGSVLYTVCNGSIYKSMDSGSNWLVVTAGIEASGIYNFWVNPLNSAELYVATNIGKLYKTSDGGTSWAPLNINNNSWPAYIKIDPRTPSLMFASISYEGGIFKSTDSGATWVAKNNGIQSISIQALAVDPNDGVRIFAGSDNGSGVFRKTGTSDWQRSASGLGFSPRVTVLTVDPATPTTVYAGTYNGVFRSTDNGVNWTALTSVFNGTSANSIHGVAVIPHTQTIYAASERGMFRSDDGGVNWVSDQIGLPDTPNAGSLAVDNAGRVYTVAAGGYYPEENGYTDGGVYRKSPGESWVKIGQTFYPGQISIDPTGTTIYAANGAGFYKSVNGSNWATINNGISGYGGAIVVDPTDPSKAYARSGDLVYRTINGGGNWTLLNTSLTQRFIGTMAIDATGTRLYLGSYTGGVFTYTLGTSVTATPTIKSFGNLLVATSLTENFSLSNTGTSNLVIDSISFTGADASMFAIDSSVTNCGQYLAPAATCTLAIKFTPTQAGDRSATCKVSFNASTGATLDLGLAGTGFNPLAINTASLSDGYVGIPYSATLQATGGIPAYSWSLVQGVLPTGLTLSSSGVISGTPTTSETPAFTTKVTDSNIPTANTASNALGIAVYTMPVITTQSLPNGTKGVAYNATLTVSGGKAPYTWTVVSGSLPAGLTLNQATGAITGTPTAASCSTPSFMVTDTNGKSSPVKLLTIPVSVVALLDAWTNLYSAAPNNTAATNLPVGSFTTGSGCNRLLLVAIVMEIGTGANPTISASYGGIKLTQIKVTNSTQREIVWMGYLKESQIGSGAKALSVTYSNAVGKASALHVKWASFSGVNQTNPFVSSAAKNTNTTSATFGTTVSYVTNGMTTVVAGNGGTPTIGTLTANPAFTAGTAITGNAQTSNSFTTASHTANGSYSSTTSVVWTGTTSSWSGLVAVSLRP